MKYLRTRLAKLALLAALAGGSIPTAHAQVPGFNLPLTATTAEILREVWNQSVSFAPQFFLRPMTLAEAQQLLPFINRAGSGSLQDAEAYIRELVRLGLIADFNAFLGSVTGADQAASAANTQVVNNVVQNSIFEKAEPAVSTAAKSAKSATVTTVFGADAFYQRTELDGGAKIKGYGTNLSLTYGDRFQFRGTVPLYKTEFGNFDATTYGLDLNGKYRVSDTFAVGAHGNYIANDSDVGDDKSWTAGVYAASAARLNEDSTLTFGLLFDRVKPDGVDAKWLGAAGLNWGIRLGRNTAFNPYGIFYRNFDAPRGADKDWFDLGAEFQFNLSETWAFKTGLKTTLGQDGVDKSYQIYLGSAWRF